MYFLLRHVAGSSSLSSSSPNSSNCFLPKVSTSVFADYPRSHFSVFQPKVMRSRTGDYLYELSRATCPEESHSSICSLFSPAEFLAAVSNLSSSTATASVIYSMLNHLARSGMDFLFHILIFPGLCISFLPSGRHLLLFPFIKWEYLSTICFLPSYLSHSCVLKLFERIILFRLLFFLESNFILSLPARPVSALDGLL